MAHEEHSTDARSIKPVSSLLSHFEGLKLQPRSPAPDPRLPPNPVRASFDVPRSDSPWGPVTAPIRGQNQNSGPNQQEDGESPARIGHRRPMSMHVGSSPQLTPAVRIDSPASPPSHYHRQSPSRSPERSNNGPVGKVRDLISASSSRSSSRPASPGYNADTLLKRVGQDNVPLVSDPLHARPPSPTKAPPPPVNRADKPKLPIKPLAKSQTVPITTHLVSEPPSGLGARISPFSTPPSSDGTPSPDEPASPAFLPDVGPLIVTSSRPLTRDARSMGFNNPAAPVRANTVTERKVVKHPASTRHVSEQVHSMAPMPPPPSISSQVSRDARQFGFSDRSTNEVRNEPVLNEKRRPSATMPPPPPREPRQSSKSVDVAVEVRSMTTNAISPPPVPISSSRDARQFGFSNTTTRDERPLLPDRRVTQAPPRPSEESKNSNPRRPSPQPPTIAEKPRQSSTPNTLKASTLPPADIRFPPPPKRNTFGRDDSLTPPHAMSRSNSGMNGLSLNQNSNYDSDEAEKSQEPISTRTDYPDASQANRRPPFSLGGQYEIKLKSDGRVFDVCGKYLCVSGYNTRVYDMTNSEQLVSLNHGETVKISSAKFKPTNDLNKEGAKLWLGSNIGEVLEVDVESNSIVTTNTSHNGRDVIRILRHKRNLWTLDGDGKLFVWRADESGEPNLKYSYASHKLPKGHTFSMAIQDKLWLATGKEVRVYKPGNESTFTTLTFPLAQNGVGDVTSGTYSQEGGGRAYFGHNDGKVTIYSTTDYAFLGTVKVSDYKINGLSFVGDRLWAAYRTGKLYVYDTSCTPWKVKKDWHAHSGPISSMILDPSSVWALSGLQVVTIGQDDMAKIWDATLEEDWMESAMQINDGDYCSFREVRAAVVTWNVGATVPSLVRSDFIADAIHVDDPPEILVFGFQEVVDLEDKKNTAKSLLGFAKKKDTTTTDQHQSRVYREWRDYLIRYIDRVAGGKYTYSELQTSSLIGLFQCVFIRQEERRHVKNLSTTNIKCGMGGHYGNKGALVTRFIFDDTSLCFINCHLAAGQSQTSHRNNDIATILESETLPAETNRQLRSSFFVGGGDGTQIMDHEICILNGDLNYRIDTIPRDTVIKMIRNNDLTKLMERDQLLVCRRRIAGFRLAPFTELPITFAPTYKYDVGTDNYDSSEKKRAPAWCDRLLFRGPGRIKQIEYRRHEVRVSDHRPVSGLFKIKVKKVDVDRQEVVRQECYARFQSVKKQMYETVCVRWLVDVMGLGEKEARRLIAG